MDEILIKYVIGEASTAEEEMVERWVMESESNGKHFAHIKLIWETSKSLTAVSMLDEENSWAEFKVLRDDSTYRMKNPAGDENDTRAVNMARMPRSTTRWMQIAALWLVIAGTAFLVFNRFHQAKPEMLTLQSFDTVKTDTLSDGSVITLNKNSVVEYPDRFTGDTREMKLLAGEAFFTIVHNQEKPFIVQVNDVAVRVVGTSFNIKNDKLKAQIIVETGIVEVTRKKILIRLVPSEKVDIDEKTGEFKRGVTKDKFYNYYRTKEFVANKTPLWRVVEVLNEVYKVDIQIPDQTLANRKLSTTLRLGSLDPILDVIAMAFNVQIVHESGKIIIR